ncbi:serine hydrolase domain-containing protein [Rossellomorea marisflavi]|uniref:serine hydrolase domain-containing protein n=1 Tax=Rossellomorea marisflavi TaxID=189381 RepID=UPI003D2F24E9
MKDGKTILEHLLGYHSFEPGAQKVNPTSRFNIASARKSYIALVIAYALYDRLLELDRPVHDYIEESNPVFSGVSIRHLLTHTHGIGEGGEGLYKDFTSGENWSYNNVGVDTLAHLVMEMYGVTISSFLQERIFDQLNWTETGWENDDSPQLVEIISSRDEKALNGLHADCDGTNKNLFVLFLQGNSLGGVSCILIKGGSVTGKSFLKKWSILQLPSRPPLDFRTTCRGTGLLCMYRTSHG